MNKHLLKHALVFAAVLTAGGCASNPGKSGLNTSVSDIPNGIGSASIGELVNTSPDDEYDASSVVVAAEYTAASGRVCRRLQTTDGMSLPRVVCKNDNGSWSWARDLLPSSKKSTNKNTIVKRAPKPAVIAEVEEPIVVTDTAKVSVAEESMAAEVESELDLSALESTDVAQVNGVAADRELDLGERVILPNETLWAFAKRTTGNALNWQRIAELNGIEDTRTILNGDVLQIPVELLRDGD